MILSLLLALKNLMFIWFMGIFFRYEVVMALLRKGSVIDKPHHHACSCSNCVRKATSDELKFAKSRLNAYKGLASESYISLSSKDPILTAFQLARELRDVASAEKYYKVSSLKRRPKMLKRKEYFLLVRPFSYFIC